MQTMDQKFEEFMKKLKPMDDRILVEPLEENTVSPSGIVLPDTASKEKPQRGKVLCIGPGKMGEDGKRIPMTVKVGNTVLFTRYGPTEVKIEGKEIYFLNESSDILAIVE